MTNPAPKPVSLEEVSCNLCGSRNEETLFPSTIDESKAGTQASEYRCTTSAYGIHPPIVRCRKCGMVYTNPRIKSDVIEKNYAAVDDPAYLAEREGRVITFRKNFLPLEELVTTKKPGRLLDVG